MISVVIPVIFSQNILEDLLKRLFTTLDKYPDKI